MSAPRGSNAAKRNMLAAWQIEGEAVKVRITMTPISRPLVKGAKLLFSSASCSMFRSSFQR